MAVNFNPPNPLHSTCNRWKRAMHTFMQQHISIESYKKIKKYADFLRSQISLTPKVGFICGTLSSELGHVVSLVKKALVIKSEEVPNFPENGLSAYFIFGYLYSVPIVILIGRLYYYDGFRVWECAMPVRLIKLLGCTHLILSDYADAINPDYNIGDIMILKDHIDFLGMTGGVSPLQGPNDEKWGPRFPPMNKAYNKKLAEIAKKTSVQSGMSNIVHEGVYAIVAEPHLESVAEVNMFKTWGIDAVGPAIVYEVITAVHCGLTVIAFALITNKSMDDYETEKDSMDKNVTARLTKQEEALIRLVTKIVQFIGLGEKTKRRKK